MPNRRSTNARLLAFVAIAALAACHEPPAPMAGEGPPPGPGEPAPTATTRFLLDVDPMRGAAFERPIDGPRGLKLALDGLEVRHDLAAGRTTVRLRVTNAGTRIDDLRIAADAGPLALARPATPGLLGVAGGTRVLTYELDNPAGGGFGLNLAFAGRQAARAVLAMVPATGVLASSSYGTLTPDRAIDGSLSTQWMDGPYRSPSSWLAVDTGAVRPIAAVVVKMAPQSGGASYVIEASDDGVAWRAASGPLRNTTWTLERKPLAAGASGRWVRLRFTNDPASPEAHFQVFEVQVDGAGGAGSPAPTTAPTATPTPVPTATPTPRPSATPTSAPTASPPATGGYLNTFEGYAEGAQPADFVDPNDEGYRYDWMPRVPWYVTSHAGSRQYMHDGLNNRALLSFRRYRGGAFGADGQLPARYAAEVAVTPLRSYTYSPTGDQGTQFYYLDPTHYFELLVKPSLFEVWVANGAEPFTSRNWQRLYYTGTTTAAGQKRRLGVEIDANGHTARVFLDGELKTTVAHAMLTAQAHWLALRGTGNVVVHDDLRIQAR